MTTQKPTPKKTPPKRRAPPKSKSVSMQLPDEAMLVDIARQLKLSIAQEQSLRVTLQHVHADLAAYHADPIHAQRSEIVRRVKLVEKAFANLEAACTQHASVVGAFPFDFLAGFGKMLTFSAMNEALGRDVKTMGLDTTLRDRIANGEVVSISMMEALSAQAREATVIKYGAEIVPAVIHKLHQPLSMWVELNKLNTGGGPKKMARYYLVARLAQAAPDIIGRKASRSQTGPFVRLCETVLPACGISIIGIDKLIPRIVASGAAKERI